MSVNNMSNAPNSNVIVAFAFDGVDVQVVSRDGEAWFVGMEVAKALGYSDTDQAIRKHCKAAENLKPVELTGLGITAKSPRGLKLIPERDLYRLVMNSEKQDALAFEEKVVGEILPAIRKTGGYMVARPEETPEEIMLRALTIAKETVSRQKNQIAELSPKAAALDAISEAEGDMGVRDAGRELDGIGQTKVTAYLIKHKWACREGKKLRPAHYGLEQKYCRLVPKPYQDRHTGETCIGHDFKITARGLARLAVVLCGVNSDAARRLNGMKEQKAAAPLPFIQASA